MGVLTLVPTAGGSRFLLEAGGSGITRHSSHTYADVACPVTLTDS